MWPKPVSSWIPERYQTFNLNSQCLGARFELGPPAYTATFKKFIQIIWTIIRWPWLEARGQFVYLCVRQHRCPRKRRGYYDHQPLQPLNCCHPDTSPNMCHISKIPTEDRTLVKSRKAHGSY